MDKDTREVLKLIHEDIQQIRKDIDDLKRFKNRVLGGLALFVFVVQSFASYIFGCYK